MVIFTSAATVTYTKSLLDRGVVFFSQFLVQLVLKAQLVQLVLLVLKDPPVQRAQLVQKVILAPLVLQAQLLPFLLAP
jgi:hypothetical protein